MEDTDSRHYPLAARPILREAGHWVVLMVRDGNQDYACRPFAVWEIPGPLMEEARARRRAAGPESSLVLRVYQTTGSDGSGWLRPPFRDVELTDEGITWHFLEVEAGCGYRVALGISRPDGSFAPQARSQPARAPARHWRRPGTRPGGRRRGCWSRPEAV